MIDDRRIRFEFKRRNSELHMIIGQLPAVFSRAWGRGKPFDQAVDEPPVASGPYVVDRVTWQAIPFRRRPDYWAADLPGSQGIFNFDKVSYRHFRDRLGEEESIKVGALDALEETSITAWVRRYKGRRFDSGEMPRPRFPHRRFTGMRAWHRTCASPASPISGCARALALAFDFDWLNQHLL